MAREEEEMKMKERREEVMAEEERAEEVRMEEREKEAEVEEEGKEEEEEEKHEEEQREEARKEEERKEEEKKHSRVCIVVTNNYYPFLLLAGTKSSEPVEIEFAKVCRLIIIIKNLLYMGIYLIWQICY